MGALGRSVVLGVALGAAAWVGLSDPGEAAAQVPTEVLGQFGIGVKGGINVSFLTEPVEQPVDLPIPGFVGNSGGFGLVFEALVLDIVGIEVDVLWATSAGKGTIEINEIDIEQRLESDELQIPVLLKAQIPGVAARPFFVAGLTFVRQSEARYNIDDSVQIGTEAFDLTSNYSMWTGGFGVAITALPYVRFPIELRGAYQDVENTVENRARYTSRGGTLSELGAFPKWEWQIWLLVGAQFTQGLDKALFF